MMKYYYNPEVKLLLWNETNKKVEMQYNDNEKLLEVPLIGPRPPYYGNPKYEQYYPTI